MLTYFPGMLASVRARLGGLDAREAGVTAVEYALMVAIIAVLLVAGFYAFFQAVETRYSDIGDCIVSGPSPEECATPPDAGGE